MAKKTKKKKEKEKEKTEVQVRDRSKILPMFQHLRVLDYEDIPDNVRTAAGEQGSCLICKALFTSKTDYSFLCGTHWVNWVKHDSVAELPPAGREWVPSSEFSSSSLPPSSSLGERLRALEADNKWLKSYHATSLTRREIAILLEDSLEHERSDDVDAVLAKLIGQYDLLKRREEGG